MLGVKPTEYGQSPGVSGQAFRGGNVHVISGLPLLSVVLLTSLEATLPLSCCFAGADATHWPQGPLFTWTHSINLQDTVSDMVAFLTGKQAVT